MLQGATVPRRPEACQNTKMWTLRKYEVHKRNIYTMYYISPELGVSGPLLRMAYMSPFWFGIYLNSVWKSGLGPGKKP
jgi:hypothetical protein